MVGALVPSTKYCYCTQGTSVTAQYQALVLLGEEGAAKLVDVQIGADNSDEMAIPWIQMIPTLWVPHFLVGLQTPEQALKMMQQLVLAGFLETEELRVWTVHYNVPCIH